MQKLLALSVVMFVMFMLVAPCYAYPEFDKVPVTERQNRALRAAANMANSISEEGKILHGEGFPRFFWTNAQVIICNETIAGEYGDSVMGIIGDGGESVGLGQVQVPTARDTIAKHPWLLNYLHHKPKGRSLTDKELMDALTFNDQFNVAIVTANFFDNYMRAAEDGYRGEAQWRQAFLAHRWGYTGARNAKDSIYLKRAEHYRAKVVDVYNKGLINVVDNFDVAYYAMN